MKCSVDPTACVPSSSKPARSSYMPTHEVMTHNMHPLFGIHSLTLQLVCLVHFSTRVSVSQYATGLQQVGYRAG